MKTRTILATSALLAAASGGALSTTATAHAQGHATYINGSRIAAPAKAASSTFVAKRLPRARALDCALRGDAARLTPSRMLRDGNYVVRVSRAQVNRSGSVTLTAIVQRHRYNHGECPQIDTGRPVHTVVPAATSIGVLGVDDVGITALTGPAWMLPKVTNPSWSAGAHLSFTSPDRSKHYRVPKSVATAVLSNSLAHVTVEHGKAAVFQVLYQA